MKQILKDMYSDLVVPPLGICPIERVTHMHKDAGIRMCRAALFVMVGNNPDIY